MSDVKYIGTKPRYMSEGASGADLAADDTYVIGVGQQEMIDTGTAMSIPDDCFGMAVPRSSLCNKQHLQLVNSVGVIDSDYRGTIRFVYRNIGDGEVVIRKGERIGQIIIIPFVKANFVQVEDLDETGRGEGGFGSTGAGS